MLFVIVQCSKNNKKNDEISETPQTEQTASMEPQTQQTIPSDITKKENEKASKSPQTEKAASRKQQTQQIISLDVTKEEDRGLIADNIRKKVYSVFGKSTNWKQSEDRIKRIEVHNLIVNVWININNFDETLFRTSIRSSIRQEVILDGWKLMKLIFTDKKLNSIPTVRLIGSLPLVDKYGHEEPHKVIQLKLTREMAQKVVWDNVSNPEAIFDEVEPIWTHYAIRD